MPGLSADVIQGHQGCRKCLILHWYPQQQDIKIHVSHTIKCMKWLNDMPKSLQAMACSQSLSNFRAYNNSVTFNQIKKSNVFFQKHYLRYLSSNLEELSQFSQLVAADTVFQPIQTQNLLQHVYNLMTYLVDFMPLHVSHSGLISVGFRFEHTGLV